MFVHYDEDEWETVKVSDPVVCSWHRDNPGKEHPNICMRHGACGCQTARFTQRRRPLSEVVRIKFERKRQLEDDIMREAKLIQARRDAEEAIREIREFKRLENQ